MSGNSYKGYAGRGSSIADYGTSSLGDSARSARIGVDREALKRAPDKPVARPVREAREVFDPALVRNRITHPSANASQVHVLLIDNSGSNRVMANHLRQTSGYLLAMLRGIDPSAELAICYFSDHCDGPDIRQDVDFVRSDETGDKTLASTTSRLNGASGGDEAEAIECILWDMCEIDFAHVPKDKRHLTLVTDVVAHGMGMRSDNGCPNHRDWKASVARVNETFGSFMVVGCSDDTSIGALQAKFLKADRNVLDHIDLSSIRSVEHRLGICGNAFLFLAARAMGQQTVVAFLMTLYEKWLSDPIFGQNTDIAAKDAIERFFKYSEIPEDERDHVRRRIFATE